MKCHINLSITPEAAQIAEALRKKYSVNLSDEFEKLLIKIAKKKRIK